MRILRGCLRLIIPSTSVAIDVDSAVTRITGRRFTRSFPPASTTNSVVQPEFVHSTSSASNTLVIGSPRSISRSSAWMARPPSTEATMDPLQVGKFECHGVGLNKHTGTRCSHWHGDSDILALLAPCCNRFYACAECHDEVNARPRGDGHTLEPWPANTDLDTMALLCGNCKRTFTISAYVGNSYHTRFPSCPLCNHDLNPGCKKHWHVYYDPQVVSRAVAGTGQSDGDAACASGSCALSSDEMSRS